MLKTVRGFNYIKYCYICYICSTYSLKTVDVFCNLEVNIKYFLINMQVFIISTWYPDSIPRIQVSGVTSIGIPHFVFKHKLKRDKHVYNDNNKRCVMGFLGFKTKKAHISVSVNLHFINLSLRLLEDLLTQNTRKYFILNTVGRFIYTKYWEILSV